MTLFRELKEATAPPIVMFNTGTLYDLQFGTYQMGKDSFFYLNGGMGPFITGLHGIGNTHKSTTIDSLVLGLLRLYPDVDLFVADTEGSKSLERIANFRTELLCNMTEAAVEDIMENITVIPPEECGLADIYERLQKIADIKEKNKKDCIVTTPFLDPKTNQFIKTWIPTIFFIDSLTELETDTENTMLDRGIEHKGNNTIWMVDGNKKTLLLRKLRKLATQYGIHVICTAHTGTNIAMDSFAPPSKQLQYMKQADKLKGVGSKFTFLTANMMQVTSKFCVDAQKQALYPRGKTMAQDLHEVTIMSQRAKLAPSGISIPYIISQSSGLLSAATHLNYLRVNGYVGLNGGPSKPKHATSWLPDVNFSRKSFREQTQSDYKLARSLELLAQYRYIQLNWNQDKIPINITRTPEEIFDLLQKNTLKMDDVLNSTGYWNYKPTERPYLSLLDVLAKIE